MIVFYNCHFQEIEAAVDTNRIEEANFNDFTAEKRDLGHLGNSGPYYRFLFGLILPCSFPNSQYVIMWGTITSPCLSLGQGQLTFLFARRRRRPNLQCCAEVQAYRLILPSYYKTLLRKSGFNRTGSRDAG